jgi:hypothetical protein
MSEGDEGESERITSTACGSIDVRGARERGQGGEAFGDLGAPDETAAAKDKRARRGRFAPRQSRQGDLEQDGIAKNAEGDRIGTWTLSLTQRHALDREA